MRILLLLMSAAVATLHAAPIVFDFAVTNVGANISITGTVTTTDLGSGKYLATAGSGFFNGDPISLIPGGPANMYSPLGLFIYDNVLYAAGNPYLDEEGLLFQDDAATGPYSGAELNIWGNGPYPPTYYSTYVGLNGGYPIADNGSIFTMSQEVPEPGTLALFGIGLVALVALRRRSA